VQKATISFVMSICVSVRPSEQLDSDWTNCHEM